MQLGNLNLLIGHAVTLRVVGLDYKKHRIQGKLIGYIENKSFLVELINKPGQVLLQRGQGVSVEAYLPTGSFQFESAIDVIHEVPRLHLALEYPLGINWQSLRAHPRIAVDTDVEVTGFTAMDMATDSMHGYMLDVSLSGARLVLEKELTKMVQKIAVGVMLESGELRRDMTLTAVVKSPSQLSPEHPDCHFAYGIEFADLEEIDKLFLTAFYLQGSQQGRALACTP